LWIWRGKSEQSGLRTPFENPTRQAKAWLRGVACTDILPSPKFSDNVRRLPEAGHGAATTRSGRARSSGAAPIRSRGASGRRSGEGPNPHHAVVRRTSGPIGEGAVSVAGRIPRSSGGRLQQEHTHSHDSRGRLGSGRGHCNAQTRKSTGHCGITRGTRPGRCAAHRQHTTGASYLPRQGGTRYRGSTATVARYAGVLPDRSGAVCWRGRRRRRWRRQTARTSAIGSRSLRQ
jgi:hypothetical protein